MNLNSKHHSTGSTCPPLLGNADNLRIYSMRFCPYAQRVLLVAEAKVIPHDIVNCNLKQKPEFLFEKNAGGKVPVIEWSDGRVLTESLVISDYLDEIEVKNSNLNSNQNVPRKLHSTDPLKKAQDRMAIEKFNSVIRSYYKIAYAVQDEPDLPIYFNKLKHQLSEWEGLLRGRNSTFFGGELPGMLDYMIWPWMERLPILGMFYPQLFNYDLVLDNLPKFTFNDNAVSVWTDEMKKDRTVAKIYLDPQLHFIYTSGSKAGSPNYDLILESKSQSQSHL